MSSLEDLTMLTVLTKGIFLFNFIEIAKCIQLPLKCFINSTEDTYFFSCRLMNNCIEGIIDRRCLYAGKQNKWQASCRATVMTLRKIPCLRSGSSRSLLLATQLDSSLAAFRSLVFSTTYCILNIDETSSEGVPWNAWLIPLLATSPGVYSFVRLSSSTCVCDEFAWLCPMHTWIRSFWCLTRLLI